MTLKKDQAERLMTELEDLAAIAYKPGFAMRDRLSTGPVPRSCTFTGGV
jgi:hypothetical protein